MTDDRRDDNIGETVELDLPVSRGGKQLLQVVSGSSCTQCALSGLGHTMCQEVKCERGSREDGQSIVYKRVEAE
jgi:hypothetical protein